MNANRARTSPSPPLRQNAGREGGHILALRALLRLCGPTTGRPLGYQRQIRCIGWQTGGVGREIAKSAQTAQSLYSGEELPSYKIPLFSRFYGDTKESASESAKYYENIIRINEHANEIKDLRAHPEHGKVSDYLKKNPDARFVGMAQAVNSNITQLNTQKRMALEKDLPKERIKRINEQIKSQMHRFNETVKAAQR